MRHENNSLKLMKYTEKMLDLGYCLVYNITVVGL